MRTTSLHCYLVKETNIIFREVAILIITIFNNVMAVGHIVYRLIVHI